MIIEMSIQHCAIPWNEISIFCSIAGFLITIWSLILIKGVKSRLNVVKKNILTKERGEQMLSELSEENEKFARITHNRKTKEMKESLNNLLSILECLSTINSSKKIFETIKKVEGQIKYCDVGKIGEYFDELNEQKFDAIHYKIDNLLKSIHNDIINNQFTQGYGF